MQFLLPSFKSHIPQLLTSSTHLQKATKTILVKDIYYNWTNQNRYVHTTELLEIISKLYCTTLVMHQEHTYILRAVKFYKNSDIITYIL